MKIIAQTEKGFLLEASRGEVANLLGEYSEYSLKGDQQPRVGCEIATGEIYRRAQGLKAGADELKRVSRTLHALADLAGEAAPSLLPPCEAPAAKPDAASGGA